MEKYIRSYHFLNKNDYSIIESLMPKNYSKERATSLYISSVHGRVQRETLSSLQFFFLDTVKKAYENTMIKMRLMGLDKYLIQFDSLDKYSQLIEFDRLMKARTYVSLCNHEHKVKDYVKKYDIKTAPQNLESFSIDEAILFLQQKNYNTYELSSLYVKNILSAKRRMAMIEPDTDKSKETISNLKALIHNTDMVLKEMEYCAYFDKDNIEDNKNLVCACNVVALTEADEYIGLKDVQNMINVLNINEDNIDFTESNTFNYFKSYKDYYETCLTMHNESQKNNDKIKNRYLNSIDNAHALLKTCFLVDNEKHPLDSREIM